MRKFSVCPLIPVIAIAALAAFAQPPGGGMGGGPGGGGPDQNSSDQKGPPQNQNNGMLSRILSPEILKRLDLTQDQLDTVQDFEKKGVPTLMKIQKDEEAQETKLAAAIFAQNEQQIDDAMIALKDVYQDKLNFQEKEVQFLMTILDPDQNRRAQDYYFRKMGH